MLYCNIIHFLLDFLATSSLVEKKSIVKVYLHPAEANKQTESFFSRSGRDGLVLKSALNVVARTPETKEQ
jgi:hypothetical protein